MGNNNIHLDSVWTEEELKKLNDLAYTMEDRYIQVDHPTTINGLKVHVVDAVQGLEGEGYNGLAVAPIINEKPDLSQIVIVSKGTNVGLNSETANAVGGKFGTSGQVKVADEFVQRVLSNPENRIVHFTGHSQGAYMLKLGAKYHIPTTVFNGWFKYDSLTKEEAKYMKEHPHLFKNYRNKNDKLVWWNDGNKVDKLDQNGFGTIIWYDGLSDTELTEFNSHALNIWLFDSEGNLISNNDSENFQFKLAQTKNDGAIALFQLNLLKGDFQQNGPITKNQQIFLDDSAALIVMQTMYNTLNIYLENAMLFYRNANGQLPEVWNDGVSAAFNAMDNLEYVEVLDALFDGGASKATVIDNYEQIFVEKLRRISEVQEKFERVIAKITKSIEEFVDADEQLSLQLNG